MLYKNKSYTHTNMVYTPFIGGYWTPTIKFLIYIHLTVFFCQLGSIVFIGKDVFTLNMAIYNLPGWQLFSHFFVHNLIPLELFFTVFTLVLMAGDLERNWGTFRFLAFYLICNVFTALLMWNFTSAKVPIIGATPSMFGILAALCLSHPQRILYGKISLKLFLLFTAIVYCIIFYLIFKSYEKLLFALTNIFLATLWVVIFPKLSRKLQTVKLIHEARKIQRVEVIREELDPLLEKISDKGIKNLTKSEKKFLKQAGITLKKEVKRIEDH